VTVKDKLEKTAKMIEENLNQDSDCDVSFQGWLKETMSMLTQAAEAPTQTGLSFSNATIKSDSVLKDIKSSNLDFGQQIEFIVN